MEPIRGQTATGKPGTVESVRQRRTLIRCPTTRFILSVSAYLVFVEGLLFVTLWLFSCAYGTAVTAALASPSGAELRAAIARVVPLAVGAVSTSVVFAASALSALTPSPTGASDIVRGVFVAIWLAHVILAVHTTHAAVRVLAAYQRSARW